MHPLPVSVDIESQNAQEPWQGCDDLGVTNFSVYSKQQQQQQYFNLYIFAEDTQYRSAIAKTSLHAVYNMFCMHLCMSWLVPERTVI